MAGKGNTLEALGMGVYNLQKDINSMFVPLDEVRVSTLVAQRNELLWNLNNPIQWRDEALAKAWSARNMDALYNAFQSVNDNLGEYDYDEGAMFKQQDFKQMEYSDRPTVALQMQARVNGRWDKKTKIAVKNRQVIESFIKERVRSIGKSANGWIECLKALGSSVAAVLPGKGKGSISKNGDQIVLNNPLGNPNGMVTRAGVMDKVIKEETVKMEADLNREIRALLLKHQTLPKKP
jgi:hypothetical protein